MAKQKREKTPEQKRLHALDQRVYVARKKINSGKLNGSEKNTLFNRIRDLNRERGFLREEIGIEQKRVKYKSVNKSDFITEEYTAWEFSSSVISELMKAGDISKINNVAKNLEPEKALSKLNEIASNMTSKQTARVYTNFRTGEVFTTIINSEEEEEEENEEE